ncbi:Two component regulator propeller [Nonlabens sp. Hel1_33_55]|uniref:helix-turn-helix and ligand-binding sensor domain-containing protein n=1 Tax=Nonlabens sp. Hel1_33_55 TaxID=1336802 RepID=UPI000875E073|nr:triple tyrosine motif-containing protein [Nonlabens sp. Hel1_33_55]SCY20896.1 Two component regulator propeller [Nonlabens sp. Hel1_33_55]
MKVFLFLCCFCCSFLTVQSQELPPIRNFSPAAYGAENQNWMVAQSADRKMYFANNQGLLEYNGEQWNLYPTPNESIMRSVAWHDGRLYSGAYMDFGYWEKQANGTLTYKSIVEDLQVSLMEDEQFWNLVSSESILLIQSLSRIYAFDPLQNTLKMVVEMEGITKLFKVGNQIFFHASDKGLYQIISGEPRLIVSQEAIDGAIIGMSETDVGLSFVTDVNTLYKLEDGIPKIISTNQFSQSVTVYSSVTLPDGGFALGTISNGLLVIDDQGAIEYQINQSNGLSNNTVLSVFLDRDQNLWLGLDNGIDYINVTSTIKTFIDRTGKLGTIYDAIYYQDYLYLGSNQGLYVKPPGSEQFQFVEGTNGQVWNLRNIEGTLFCAHNLGTFVINGTTATKIEGEAGTWDIQPLVNQPNLLIQGNYTGLYVLENINGEWIQRNKVAGFDISSKDIVVDDNTIYVGHEYKGLYEILVDDDFRSVNAIKIIESVGIGINSDVIQLGGDIVYSNSRGIYVKSKGTDKFIRNEFMSSQIDSNGYTSGKMIKTKEDSFWMFSDKSLTQFSKEPINDSYESSNIFIPHYNRSETKGYESLIQLPNQNYLISTSQGYLILEGKDLIENNNEIRISKVLVKSRKREDRLLQLQEPNSLQPSTSTIEFFFYTTDYDVFSDLKYQYILEGNNDDNWSQPFEKGSVLFENLGYGDYNFRIRAVINGIEAEDESSFQFTINPPFYLSKVAIVIYVFLIIGLVFLLSRIFRWYYNRKRDYELEKQRQQMELDLLQSQKDIAELKNKQLNSDIESRNRDLAIKTMAMIRKNESLNQLRGELEALPTTNESKSLKKMLDKNLNSKQDWIAFEEAFNNADKNFFKKIKDKHPNLTSGDLRLCVYLRLNLTSKEIAPLLNISPRSVEIKRYRLRKKMDLSREESLTSYIVEI